MNGLVSLLPRRLFSRDDPGTVALPSSSRDQDAIEAVSSNLPEHRKNVSVGLGVRVLWEPPQGTDSVVDIVFVHGLTGSSSSTWYHAHSGTFWPTHLLSEDIPNTRIISFGYDADFANFWSLVSENRVDNHALNLLGKLSALREKTNTGDRKIVFVAHSLGGLVVEDCLCLSRDNAEKHLRKVGSRTMAILFLGTPQHGADLAAWAESGSRIARMLKQTNPDILAVLKPQSEVLARIQNRFHSLLRLRKDETSEIAITSFYEELPIRVVGKVVEQASATIPGYPYYSIHDNHMDMTKFPDAEDDGYIAVLGELQRWAKAASPDRPKGTKSLFLVPFDRDPSFIDRIEVFQRIEEQSVTQRRIALWGIGGIGKSQIAVEFCYRYQEAHPKASVFWVHASTRNRFEQDYITIARRLKLPGWDDVKIDTLQLVFEWFKGSSSGQWLMVIDGADDLDEIFNVEPSSSTSGSNIKHDNPLVNYLPRLSEGQIIITTRDKRLGERLASRTALTVVQPMDLEQGHDLLRSHVEDFDSEDSITLLDELGYIPLAITQAAAYVSQNNITLKDYLAIMRESDGDMQVLLEEDVGDRRRDSRSQHSVIRTWKLTFDSIAKQRPRAAEMLSLMAMVDRNSIPRRILEIRIDDTSLDDPRFEKDKEVNVTSALGTLQAFSLIKANYHGSTFAMHRLVQLATRRWLEIKGTKVKWQEQALLMIRSQFPTSHPYFSIEYWPICASLAPHAEIVLQYEYHKRGSLLQYMELTFQLGKFHELQRLDDAVVPKFSTAYQMSKSLWGLENEDTLYYMVTLAGSYTERGRWEEAEQLAKQCAEISKRVNGRRHGITIRALGILAAVYEHQNRYQDAVEVLLQAVESPKIEDNGVEIEQQHLEHLMAVWTLAKTYTHQNKWKEAEVVISDALEQYLKHRADEPLVPIFKLDLASCYRAQGRLAEAEELQLEILAVAKGFRRTWHLNLQRIHLNLQRIMIELAGTYECQKRFTEARLLYRDVLKWLANFYGANHPDTLRLASYVKEIEAVIARGAESSEEETLSDTEQASDSSESQKALA